MEQNALSFALPSWTLNHKFSQFTQSFWYTILTLPVTDIPSSHGLHVGDCSLGAPVHLDQLENIYY